MPLRVLVIAVVGLFIGLILDLIIYKNVGEDFDKMDNGNSNDRKWHGAIKTNFFLLLKGRCGSIGTKAIIKMCFLMSANCTLYLIVFMANGWNILSILYCLMTSAFLVISIVDELTFEIPFPCNLFLGVVGVLVCIWDHQNIISHIIGFFAISLMLYFLFVFSKGAAIGGGDIKLMAVGGLILGWKLIILSFFVGCIIASVCHVTRMKISKAERVLAMGPYLCIALWICALWGNKMISWYLDRLGIQ